ncbi:hypothetical protein L0128_00820 [candidate division KSB1 bacterium]|nr:hypothetical protein [candidate division KSB1 bacterium]
MIPNMMRKAFDFVCQKIVDLNNNVVSRGGVEINPQYYNEILFQSNVVENRINQLETYIVRTKLKEEMYKEGITRCNYIIENVFPLLGSAMSLLKQSLEFNSQMLKKQYLLEKKELQLPANILPKESQAMVLSSDESMHFQNINLMLTDSFERLRGKRKEIDIWLSQIKSSPAMIPESQYL